MQKPDPATVTYLLQAISDGNPDALDQLFPLVYGELKDRARMQRRRLGGHLTMNTTALVHEAYLKLAAQTQFDFDSRAHFYAVAAKAMRHIFLDYAKRKAAAKRGGNADRIELRESALAGPVELKMEEAEEVLRLERALERLARESERQVNVIECRFYGGLTIDETATALDISPATVKRDWVSAMVSLHGYLE